MQSYRLWLFDDVGLASGLAALGFTTTPPPAPVVARTIMMATGQGGNECNRIDYGSSTMSALYLRMHITVLNNFSLP